jgi:hypothetical protein
MMYDSIAGLLSVFLSLRRFLGCNNKTTKCPGMTVGDRQSMSISVERLDVTALLS